MAKSHAADVVENLTWDDVHQVMQELRQIAQRLLTLENNAQSLTPTGLVLTALRRQVPCERDWQDVTWKDRSYFLGAMYQAMRRALIDHARARNAKKRSRLRTVRVEEIRLDDLAGTAEKHPEHVEALTLALERLRVERPEWAALVEHRYFAGYTIGETARVLGRSEKTVRRWWEQARVLLHDEVLRLLNTEDGSTS